MSHLEVHLFGGIRLVLDGVQIKRFRSQKAPLLLAYLFSQRGRSPSRIEIATALFPAQDEQRGRANLRTTLCRLRQLLETEDSNDPPWLIGSNQALEFNWNSDYWLDAEVFDKLCHELFQDQSAFDRGLACQAVNLYKGDFLAGHYDDWLLPEAARFRDMYESLLVSLADLEAADGYFAEAESHLRELLSLSPFDEAVHKRLILLSLKQGDTASAMNQYRLCERLLATEMGIEPCEETQALKEHWHNAPKELTLEEQVAFGQLDFGERALAEGHHTQAERSLQVARRSLRELHVPEELQALYQLGRVALKEQRLGQAQRRFSQLRRIATRAGNTEYQALALNALGATDAALDHTDEAKEQYEQAVGMARRGHHPDAEWRALTNLGRNHWIRGRYDESLRCYLRGQVLCERLKHPTGLRIIQENLGILYGYLGLFEDAHHCFEASQALLAHDPNPMKLRTLWANWGDVYERQELYAPAEACYRRGYETCWSVEDGHGCAVTLINLASVRQNTGDARYAAKLLARVLPVLRKTGPTRLVLEAAHILAKVRMDQKRCEEAQVLIKEALDLLQRGITCEEPDKIYATLAAIHWHCRNRTKARRALQHAWQILERRADRISRPRYRRSFIENVPAHKRIKQKLDARNDSEAEDNLNMM